jgi:dATP pyrophosphohydrolase
MECEQYYRLDLNCISVLPVFVAFIDVGELVRLNYEHPEFGWFSISQAKKILPLPIQRKLLERIEEEFILSQPPVATKVMRSGV